jgi:hypothetical protein
MSALEKASYDVFVLKISYWLMSLCKI